MILLDMEKISAGQLRFDLQVQALMPLVEQSPQANQGHAEQFRVRLVLADRVDGARVRAAAQRLQQVLSNFERIFQKFSQADASDTRQKGGTGLGPAITRQLAERMGGRVGFDSAPGRGATFFIDLPECRA